MKEVCFSNWERALEEVHLAASTRRSFAITIQWYLGFCRSRKEGTTHQSVRDFIEFAGIGVEVERKQAASGA